MLARRSCGFVESNTLTERGLERAGSLSENSKGRIPGLRTVLQQPHHGVWIILQ